VTDYRRNFLPGGSYFSTVNLAERRLALLTERIDLLRAAFRGYGPGIRLRLKLLWFCPITCT
jgi:REP element-mobilizing transposase RayT